MLTQKRKLPRPPEPLSTHGAKSTRTRWTLPKGIYSIFRGQINNIHNTASNLADGLYFNNKKDKAIGPFKTIDEAKKAMKK